MLYIATAHQWNERGRTAWSIGLFSTTAKAKAAAVRLEQAQKNVSVEITGFDVDVVDNFKIIKAPTVPRAVLPVRASGNGPTHKVTRKPRSTKPSWTKDEADLLSKLRRDAPGRFRQDAVWAKAQRALVEWCVARWGGKIRSPKALFGGDIRYEMVTRNGRQLPSLRVERESFGKKVKRW